MKTTNLFTDITNFSILSLIWQKKVISRVEIANILNIDKSTVTKYVTKLLGHTIIHEIAEGKVGPQGGRKPILLEINPKFACIGGIELNSERYICLLLDMHGNILFKIQKEISPEIFSFLGAKGIFTHAYNILAEEANRIGLPLIAVGAGMPGLIDARKGIIKQSISLLIHDEYDFYSDVQKNIPVPLFIDNDARCCCFAEKLIQRDNPAENVLFLLLDYRITEPHLSAKKSLSVGVGFIFDNKIFSGSDSLAGEFRSILWKRDFGGQFSSRVDILDDFTDHTISFSTASLELAKHIAFLVNMLNLKTVYVCGDKLESMQMLQSEMIEQIEYLFPYEIADRCSVRSSTHDDLSVSYGAGAMCLERIFMRSEEHLRQIKIFNEIF